jgi:hypothetical protein
LRCKVRALTADEKAAVKEAKDIDELYPRTTPAEVKILLERITSGADEEADTSVAKVSEQEAIKDL